MRLHFQLYVAAAVAAAVSAASESVLPACGVPQMISSAMLTISPRRDKIFQGNLPVMESQAQMVLLGCTEMFGESTHSCLVCGGESISTPGECVDLNALNLVRESKLST